MDLEERLVGDRADWKHSLGEIDAETACLSARHNESCYLSSPEGYFAKFPCIVISVARPDDGRGLNSLWRRELKNTILLPIERPKLVQIQCLQLVQECGPLIIGEIIPPPQDMILTIAAKTLRKLGGHGGRLAGHIRMRMNALTLVGAFCSEIERQSVVGELYSRRQ